jgi:hypothetical protein
LHTPYSRTLGFCTVQVALYATPNCNKMYIKTNSTTEIAGCAGGVELQAGLFNKVPAACTSTMLLCADTVV